MKLLTKEIEKRFKEVGTQEEVEDPIIIAKFFNPTGAGTWYAISYDPDEQMFFGLAHILEAELGYFSLAELQQHKGQFGLGIERDIYFGEKPLSSVNK